MELFDLVEEKLDKLGLIDDIGYISSDEVTIAIDNCNIEIVEGDYRDYFFLSHPIVFKAGSNTSIDDIKKILGK